MIIRAALGALVLASLVLAGCRSVTQSEAAPGALSLQDTDWVLIEYKSGRAGEDAVEVAPYTYTLRLDASGSAQFKLDCNRGTSTWQASPMRDGGGSLTFGRIAATMAACATDARNEVVLRDMERVTGYSVYDGRLTMSLGSSGESYVWDRID